MEMGVSLLGLIVIIVVVGLLFGVGYLIVEHFFDKKF